ncbi:hypothetical protein ACN47E_004779 [Coniothyrium glycines]
MAARAVFITGATGKQGGSVINALLKANANFDILALTRDTKSSSALNLAQKSPKIKLVAGNLNAIEEAFETAKAASEAPVWGVFSVQTAMGSGQNAKSEECQGKALIDASLKHGVKRFVYSSVDRGGDKSETNATNIPHFISKHRIEQHLIKEAEGTDMKWTILRPVAFYENLTPDFFGKIFTTSWAMTLRKEQKLQLIATSDIGFLATQAFLGAEGFENKGRSIAGDELTYDEFKSIFEQQTGQALPTTFTAVAAPINWMVKDLGYMFKWFRDVGYGANIASIKNLNPEMKDFKAWLASESSWKS